MYVTRLFYDDNGKELLLNNKKEDVEEVNFKI